jgi:Flp pilus assembly protein TadD
VDRDPDRGLYRLDLFRRLEAVGDWTGLVAASSEAGAEAVGGGRASFYRGIAFARLGQDEAAVEALSRVVQHGNPDPVALAGSAGHLLQLGAYAPAESTARAAVAGRVDDPALHHLLAMVLTRQTREQEALAYYRRAAELMPEDANFRFDLLVSLCSLDRTGELESGMDRALKDFDGDPRFAALSSRCGTR